MFDIFDEIPFEYIILGVSVLVLLSILLSKFVKYGIPALLIFICLGMLAGSDGIGGFYFDDPLYFLCSNCNIITTKLYHC